MHRFLVLAAGLVLLAIAFGPRNAAASPLAPGASGPAPATAGIGLVEKVQWRRCRRWRWRCADRWGWGTYRFRRCLRRHGCARRRGFGLGILPGIAYCAGWRAECADRWGWGTRRFRRCLRRHGC